MAVAERIARAALRFADSPHRKLPRRAARPMARASRERRAELRSAWTVLAWKLHASLFDSTEAAPSRGAAPRRAAADRRVSDIRGAALDARAGRRRRIVRG